jgi:hypothetical protein
MGHRRLAHRALGLLAVGLYAFLREADELVRRIHLEAIVVGFWTGTGFGIGYRLLEHAGLRALNPSMTIAIMVAVMLLGYAVGRFRAGKRYR